MSKPGHRRTFEAISQRVNLRFHLTWLPEPETYIGHHLKMAGVAHPLFSDEAVRLINHFTKGIPRRLNNLGTACRSRATPGGNRSSTRTQ